MVKSSLVPRKDPSLDMIPYPRGLSAREHIMLSPCGPSHEMTHVPHRPENATGARQCGGEGAVMTVILVLRDDCQPAPAGLDTAEEKLRSIEARQTVRTTTRNNPGQTNKNINET